MTYCMYILYIKRIFEVSNVPMFYNALIDFSNAKHFFHQHSKVISLGTFNLDELETFIVTVHKKIIILWQH